jgi:hypothetical protein
MARARRPHKKIRPTKTRRKAPRRAKRRRQKIPRKKTQRNTTRREKSQRKKRHRTKAASVPTPRPRPVRVTLPRPTRAETMLLALAKDLAGAPLDHAVKRLADAFAPSADLPGEIYAAWIKSRREKTASLALSWAREQLRLSLEETIARSPAAKLPAGLAPDTLAWLVLAACEAIAHEPPSAVVDRVRAVLELSGHAAPAG